MISQYMTTVRSADRNLRAMLYGLSNAQPHDRVTARYLLDGAKSTISHGLAAWMQMAADPVMGASWGEESVRLSLLGTLAAKFESALKVFDGVHAAWNDGTLTAPDLTPVENTR